jgi:hypothetical protein
MTKLSMMLMAIVPQGNARPKILFASCEARAYSRENQCAIPVRAKAL